MSVTTYTIVAAWDEEAEVWYTEDTDVPGLVVEAVDFETFVSEARQLVPELLRLNGALPDPPVLSIPLHVIRSEQVRLAG